LFEKELVAQLTVLTRYMFTAIVRLLLTSCAEKREMDFTRRNNVWLR
jgi:hypothetical protein